MSSVKRRPDGSWRARYRDLDGKEHAKHFARKTDADRWVTAQAASVDRGEHIDPRRSRVTLSKYVARWLEAQTLRPSSRRTYISYLDGRILPAFGPRPLNSITPTDVRGWTRQLATELAPNTVRAVHNILASVLNDAVDDGYLSKSPCAKTTPAKPKRAKVVPLTVDQVQALIDEMPERYRATVVVGACCGLRIGETLGLKVGRIRFLQSELDVVEQLILLPGAPPHLAPLKTSSSERTVPLPKMAVDALAAHLLALPGRTGRSGVPIEDGWSGVAQHVRVGCLEACCAAGAPSRGDAVPRSPALHRVSADRVRAVGEDGSGDPRPCKRGDDAGRVRRTVAGFGRAFAVRDRCGVCGCCGPIADWARPRLAG